jgi:hypothetical protein
MDRDASTSENMSFHRNSSLAPVLSEAEGMKTKTKFSHSKS